jgi:hypothetical protein
MVLRSSPIGSYFFVTQQSVPEDWRDWIAEAHRVVEEWEASTSARMLSMRDSVALAERIARALHSAFQRGRGS